jgi:Flp pilus assembly protein CpaB
MDFAQRLFTTRGGTLVLAGLAAALAAVVVFVYINKHDSSVKSGGQAATVLVAKAVIAKGTPGAAVANNHLFQAIQIRESQLRAGAIADPSTLVGRVAVRQIPADAQLTTADFGGAETTIATNLTAGKRAISIPFDTAHGMIGNVRTGDKVDVYAGFNVIPIDKNGNPVQSSGQNRPVLRLIAAGVPVLNIGTKLSGQTNVTLDVAPGTAAKIAFSSDNGKVWLVLRPPTGAGASPPDIVTIETLLLGIPPIQELKAFGGRG